MNRRALLALAAGAASVAGCSGGDTVTAGETQQGGVVDTEFSVRERGPGVQRDAATVTFRTDSVVVEGTIWGTDGCKTATLAGTDYDPDSGELVVRVATTDREDAGDVCTQAIVEVAYRATVTFDGDRATSAVVTHDRGDGAAEVTRASA